MFTLRLRPGGALCALNPKNVGAPTFKVLLEGFPKTGFHLISPPQLQLLPYVLAFFVRFFHNSLTRALLCFPHLWYLT